MKRVLSPCKNPLIERQPVVRVHPRPPAPTRCWLFAHQRVLVSGHSLATHYSRNASSSSSKAFSERILADHKPEALEKDVERKLEEIENWATRELK
jgi:hypothetical protein